ncbi:hypothetical protein HK097_000777 [Rhizophlyctis rosea]|uniref:Uncharacterized protein n=1 Tax=Rhizophlyctis rosea TaxID=64517 RepID=A0AAD5S6B9_9FUNG|nr:hypothetical protein HK097_000777 [Rhizophlyctis rosea]
MFRKKEKAPAAAAVPPTQVKVETKPVDKADKSKEPKLPSKEITASKGDISKRIINDPKALKGRTSRTTSQINLVADKDKKGKDKGKKPAEKDVKREEPPREQPKPVAFEIPLKDAPPPSNKNRAEQPISPPGPERQESRQALDNRRPKGNEQPPKEQRLESPPHSPRSRRGSARSVKSTKSFFSSKGEEREKTPAHDLKSKPGAREKTPGYDLNRPSDTHTTQHPFKSPQTPPRPSSARRRAAAAAARSRPTQIPTSRYRLRQKRTHAPSPPTLADAILQSLHTLQRTRATQHYAPPPSKHSRIQDEDDEDIAHAMRGATDEDKVRLLSVRLEKEKERRMRAEYERVEMGKQVGGLRKRVLREAERAKALPKVTSVVPTSVEANLNLRYMFKKSLDVEREKYAKLEAENRSLHGRIKNLETQILKKGVTLEHQSHRTNEILYWRNKHRDLESSKHATEDLVASLRKQLERETKDKQRVAGELETLRQWQSAQLRVNFGMEKSESGTGHRSSVTTAGGPGKMPLGRGRSVMSPVMESPRTGIMSPPSEKLQKPRLRSKLTSERSDSPTHSSDEDHPKPFKSKTATKKRDVADYVQPPDAHDTLKHHPEQGAKSTNQKQKPRHPHTPDFSEAGEDTEDEDERLREAKIRLAYDAWVLNKEKEEGGK